MFKCLVSLSVLGVWIFVSMQAETNRGLKAGEGADLTVFAKGHLG